MLSYNGNLIHSFIHSFTPAIYLTDLDFADDIVLFGSSIANAQKLVTSLEKAALKVGLRINQTKTEYILIGDWGKRKQKNIKVCGGPLKRVMITSTLVVGYQILLLTLGLGRIWRG